MIFPSIKIRIERWKFNKDYGIWVSTLGNFKDRHKRNLPIKISNRNGYCKIWTEQGKYRYAHRLVMLTWKPIPDAENLTVDHKNHNKRDNSLENLEWVTAEENCKRAQNDYLIDEEVPTGANYTFHFNRKIYLSRGDAVQALYDYNPTRPKEKCIEIIDDLISGKNLTGKKSIGKTGKQRQKISIEWR